MSNSIFMDESNGNGLFAYKISPTPTTSAPSITTSVSNEDLSQSLSEYTDADESISAPTEFLAEFLSAVMLKDYKKALKYCELILQYEPNNATAKEFYPIIQEKLKRDSSSESDENYNKSSSPEMGLDELQGTNESDVSNSSNGVDDDGEQDEVDVDADVEVDDMERDGDISCMDSSDISLSRESVGGEEDIESDSDDATSSDLDEQNLDMVPNSGNSSSGGEGRSRSDNTTHSYSSLLLEEEDEDIVPANLNLMKKFSPDLDISNGNIISASCSDSESPTEPLTQRLAAILRSKCVPGKEGGNETS